MKPLRLKGHIMTRILVSTIKTVTFILGIVLASCFINLTQEILDRMEKGGKEAGTEIAIETLEQIKKMAAGVHIMPLNDIDTTLHIIDHV